MEAPERPELGALEARLGYTFENRQLLETALTHKSYANEQSAELSHNERMEFLGDAVVSLVVGHLLMSRHPEWNEGTLSKARSALVSAAALAGVARELGLGEWLLLGRGERRTGGRRKQSILADAFEAVSAAIYLDGGFVAAMESLRSIFEPRLDSVTSGIRRRDAKTHLQERIQAAIKQTPRYVLKETSGPEHDLRFTVEIQVDRQALARGQGRTKKEAEQAAAAKVLARLSQGLPIEELVYPAAGSARADLLREEPGDEDPSSTASR